MAEQGTQEVKPVKFEKTYKAFDIDKFEKVDVDVEGEFHPAVDLREALERFDNNQEKVLAVLNDALLKQTQQQAKKEVFANLPNVLSNTTALRDVVNSFRTHDQFKSIIPRKEQTKAIYDMIKAKPALIELVKTWSAELVQAGEDEEEADLDEE